MSNQGTENRATPFGVTPKLLCFASPGGNRTHIKGTGNLRPIH